MTKLSSRVLRLSICIATLNRSRYIGDTLDSIIRQLTSDVEIVVLDGASTDGTEAILRERVKTCEQLRYIRQATNCGIDRDYNTAVEFCDGEYVWLMTDDDLLKPGAINAVLHALKDVPSLVVVNAEVRNANMSQTLQPRRLNIAGDMTFGPSESDSLMMLAGDYLSFIGCVVIRHDVWTLRKKEPYFGTLFIHVGIIFQAALPKHAIVIAAPFIAIRYGNAMWRPKEFEIWMFKWPNLIWSFLHLSDAAKASVSPPDPWRKLSALLLYRARGSYTPDQYRLWLRQRLPAIWGRSLAASIAYLPGQLVNSLAVVYGIIARRGTNTGLMDLKSSRFYIRNWLSARRN